jgi:predicted flap endonuclease-1-like 5' DNA nuclease
MSDLLSLNLIPILIALAIGLIVGWWAFKRARQAGVAPPTAKPVPTLDGREGNSLADEEAAAVADVVGEFVGADVHSEIPGAIGPADNLQTMKGVGPKLAAKLNENGVIRFDQLAALTPAQAAALDARMEPFTGRIARDRLIEQAGFLASGDTAGFETRFGKLGTS